jgi:hypothetical protein
MASMEGPSVTTFTYTICANTAAVTVAGRATDNSQFMQPAARALNCAQETCLERAKNY